jgi:hypothetical protein
MVFQTNYIDSLKFNLTSNGKRVNMLYYLECLGYVFVKSLFTQHLLILDLPEISSQELFDYGFKSKQANECAFRNYHIGNRPLHHLVKLTGKVKVQYCKKNWKCVEDVMKHLRNGKDFCTVNEKLENGIITLQRLFRIKFEKKVECINKIKRLIKRKRQKKQRKVIFEFDFWEDPITNNVLEDISYFIKPDYDSGNKTLYNTSTIIQLNGTSPFTRKTFGINNLMRVNLQTFTMFDMAYYK